MNNTVKNNFFLDFTR